MNIPGQKNPNSLISCPKSVDFYQILEFFRYFFKKKDFDIIESNQIELTHYQALKSLAIML